MKMKKWNNNILIGEKVNDNALQFYFIGNTFIYTYIGNEQLIR